jgi:hypothetical protein
MATEQLTGRLRALRAELAGLQSLDPDAKSAAGALLAEFRRLNVEAAGSTATPGGLEALAVRFEADHPSVAAALRQVADQLGKAGI